LSGLSRLPVALSDTLEHPGRQSQDPCAKKIGPGTVAGPDGSTRRTLRKLMVAGGAPCGARAISSVQAGRVLAVVVVRPRSVGGAAF